MLKRKDPPLVAPEGPAAPESIGGLFGRAKDEAVAWAQAEVALYRTIGGEKAKAWRLPLVLFATALFLAHAATLTLVATLFVGLAQVINPALAGLLSVVILAAVAAVLVKIAIDRLPK